MKHNMKNRPSHEWMYQNLDKIEVVEAWFNDFEKELRDMLKSAKRHDQWQIENLLREIIGEEIHLSEGPRNEGLYFQR